MKKINLTTTLKIVLLTAFLLSVTSQLFAEDDRPDLKNHPDKDRKHHKQLKHHHGKNPHQKANLLIDYDYVLDIEGLVCSFCVNKLRGALKKIDFIKIENKKDLFVNIKKQKVFFKIYPDKSFDLEKIKKVTGDSGYNVLHIGVIKKGVFKKKKAEVEEQAEKNQIVFITKAGKEYIVAEDIGPKKLAKIKKQLKRKKSKIFILFFKDLVEEKIYKIDFIK